MATIIGVHRDVWVVGETYDGQELQLIRIDGASTHFRPIEASPEYAMSTVVFAPSAGITVAPNVLYRTQTRLYVAVTVSPTCSTGSRSITVETPLVGGGAETAIMNPAALVVDATVPIIRQIDPIHGIQGEELYVDIEGSNTIFLAGSATAKFYDNGVLTPDIEVLETVVADFENCTAHIIVKKDCDIGFYDINVINE